MNDTITIPLGHDYPSSVWKNYDDYIHNITGYSANYPIYWKSILELEFKAIVSGNNEDEFKYVSMPKNNYTTFLLKFG